MLVLLGVNSASIRNAPDGVHGLSIEGMPFLQSHSCGSPAGTAQSRGDISSYETGGTVSTALPSCAFNAAAHATIATPRHLETFIMSAFSSFNRH
jgi:hypothetical protein